MVAKRNNCHSLIVNKRCEKAWYRTALLHLQGAYKSSRVIVQMQVLVGQSSYESNKFPSGVVAAYAGLWATCSSKAVPALEMSVGSKVLQNQKSFCM